MTKIEVAKDYNIFKQVEGNRIINWGHVNRLEESMKERDYLTSLHPILVNESFEIIDGQHRLEALKRLNKPVYYIKSHNLGLKDVQTLNALSKNWTHRDFALSYSKIGITAYTIYLDIASNYFVKSEDGKKTFKLKHNVLLRYLIGEGVNNMNAIFKAGELQIDNENLSRLKLEQLLDVAKISHDPHKMMGRDFGYAFFTICSNPEYNHKRMLDKMAKFSEKMGKCENVQDFTREIEKIYNRHALVGEQVRFF